MARAGFRMGMLSAALLLACSSTPQLTAPRLEQASSSEIPAGPFELAELSILELQAQMQRGERTAVDIAELYLRRIDALNRAGPELRAVIEINPDALSIAAALDRERQTRGVRGPLHGIPVLVKDNIATADSMETTAGSLALVGRRPRRDSTVVARLRAAGAVILGKSNMSEWANFRTARSSSGWSARGGQTRNPYLLSHSPCGSSSGSAVGVAANLAAGALGTETNGSIICPSSANGVVGIKPTVGLVSRAGVIPIAHTTDAVGPIARTVEDAAILLAAIAGPDPADSTTADSRSHVRDAYVLDREALRGARLGVARSHFGVDPRVDRVVNAAIELMRQQGAVIVDVELPGWSDVGASIMTMFLHEFKVGVAEYLAQVPGPGVQSIADIIAFNKAHADKELRYLGQDLLERAAQTRGLDDPAYLRAHERVVALERSAIDSALVDSRLDAIVAPSGGPAWAIDLVNGDNFKVGSSTPAAVAGYPNVTVPAGMIEGLPVGVSFFGARWSEPRLLSIAYAFERVSMKRRRPELRRSLSD